MSHGNGFSRYQNDRARDILANDTSLRSPETTISFNPAPLSSNPQLFEGYRLVNMFTSYRGRLCGEYEDTNTGEHVYMYGDPDRTAI